MANPSCHNPDPDLAERRFGQLHRFQFECLTLFVGYCSFDFHGSLLVHSNAPTDWAGARSIQKMRRFRTGIAWVCVRSEEHTSELQSRPHLVCRLLLEKKKKEKQNNTNLN